MIVKKSCEEYGVMTKRLRRVKGFYYCWNCWRKKLKIIHTGKSDTIEEALEKTYNIKLNLKKGKSGNKYYYGVCSFPKILIGKEFKAVLV